MRVTLSDILPPAYHDLHRDVRARGHREYWLRGGRGSGKSTFASVEIILEMLRDPNLNCVVYRKVASTIRQSVYEQIAWAVNRLGLTDYFRFRLAPMEMEYLPTGQKILFRGADDPGKSKSIKPSKGFFGILWFEELDEFSGMDEIRSIKASILRGGDRGMMIATYNPPKSQNSWVNAEAMFKREDRRVHASTYLDLPKDWLGGAFLDDANALKRMNPDAYRHMYLGEITGSGGQVFDNVVLRALTQEERSCDPVWCGLDFGFAVDPDAFVVIGCDKSRSRLFILDEFRGQRATVDVLAREILARTDGVVRCDSADPRMIAQLRTLRVNAIGAKKGRGSVAAGIRWLQERSEIVIDPAGCPNAAREFASYEYARGGDGGFLSEYPDRDNHFIDAVRYAAEPLMNLSQARTFQYYD